MGPHRRTRTAVALLAAALALGLGAAVALGGVAVYKNNFSSKAEAQELRKSRGKHCGKRWRRKAESVRAKRTRGSGACGYRPPVEGDTSGPDHDFWAKTKLLRATPKGIRGGAYLAISVRSGKNSGYELRIFPKKHKYELRRSPSGGGAGFPAEGRNRAIKGVNKPNVVRLKAVGDKVTARVNGTKVANVTDSNAGQVGGRKLEVAVGNKRRSRKDVVATFDNLKLAVPNP
jgi:ribosomal protein S8E